MRVLYVLTRDDKYGSPMALMELITTLKKIDKNFEPVVLTPTCNDINKKCNDLKIENYSILYGTSMYIKRDYIKNILRFLIYKYGNIVSLKKISKTINLKNIDIIHSNNSVIDFGYLISKKYNIPHVWHIREFADQDFNYYPFDKKYINKMNDSNYCVTISKVIDNYWKEKKLLKSNIINDGIDFDSIETKKEYNKEKKLKILFIGSLCSGKGQYKLINALSMIDKNIISNLDVHFVGSGSNKYVEELKQMINKYNLSKTIKFDGYNNNIRKIIKDYDLGIICSKKEGFGRVTVEYMASGLCVIASNSGANPEIICDNKTGILFDYENDSDLYEKIIYVYKNRDKIREIGTNAAADVRKKYSKEINAGNVYKLYMEIKENK